MHGLTPHTRGDDHSCEPLRRRGAGATPTRVGTTPATLTRSTLLREILRAHPHTRGDDIAPTKGCRRERAWGLTPTRVGTTTGSVSTMAALAGDGLTPTRVGTTITAAQRPPGHVGAHPHTRGDDSPHARPLTVPSSTPQDGSPPHAWGRRMSMGRDRQMHEAHPHTRGDDDVHERDGADDPGSPPHAWGRPGSGQFMDQQLSRLTPTRVGTKCVQKPDQPEGHLTRVGTTPAGPGWRPARDRKGSPPHAWGRRTLVPGDDRFGQRLTPTRVGTTSGTTPTDSLSRAHPHTRGDDQGHDGLLRGSRTHDVWTWTHPHTRGDDDE